MSVKNISLVREEVAVGTTDTEIGLPFPIEGPSIISVQVHNRGATALNSFAAQFQMNAKGDWFDFLRDANFQLTTDASFLKAGPNDVQTLAGGAKTFIHLRISGGHRYRFVGTVAAGTTSIEVDGRLQREDD